MRLTHLFASVWLILILYSCGTDSNRLTAINSQSFHESQVTVHFQPDQLLASDSLVNDSGFQSYTHDQKLVLDQLDEMILTTELIRKSESDSSWIDLTEKWAQFNTNHFENGRTPFTPNYSSTDSVKIFPEAISKWAKLNIALVKLSGEARFGDALEKMLYSSGRAFITEKLVKSVIYTHVFDQIFINLIGSSSVDYQHTTGGNVRLIQETDYPNDNEMTLKSECSDKRFMDVFIRIPSWAVNPTVTHGNVKYVARPGEYCQISRKWKTGDEIKVMLKN